ncbi:choice-of-anchor G family protein, partial [Glutamicibacter arilaitensis]|uniref:choice-of-anchor G family protein n=2 Tax=Glutamicibacter arilaitensis TaxID=256701 RepID=UPI0011AF5A37
MQANNLSPKNGKKPRAARRVLAGAVVASLFVAPTVTAAYAAPADGSEALGRVLDVNLLDIPVADAGFAYAGNPSSPGPVHDSLNVEVLSGLTLDLGTGLSTMPLINGNGDGLLTLGEAGLVSSYAEAPSTTSAKAGAGAVSSDGAIGLDDISSDDMTANVDLTRLLGQLGVDGLTDQIIDEASLEIGALGSTADKTDGTLDRQYLVAGASATVSSPAVEGLTGSLGSVVDGLGDTLNTTLSVDGALGTIVSQLEALSIPLGLLGTLGVTEASVGLEGLAAALDQVKNDVLTGVITTNTGLVSIDLGSGDVTVDLAQITTGGLNGKTPNYEVLSPTAVQEIADEITLALSNLITDLRDTLVAALDEIDIVVNLGVNLGLVDGTADITGSVASFLGLVETDPTTVVDLDVLGLDLGAVVTPLLEGVTGIVGGAVGTAINPMINGLAGTITGIVEDVTEPLEPVVEGVLNEIVEITVNEQGSTAIYDPITDTESTEAGDYVAALSVTLLPAMGHSANKISFARSEVRAADEASVIITSPETGAQIPEGEVVTVEGTAEPGKTITVTLDDLTREDIVDEDGTWTVDFEGVTPGEKTAVATDGDDDDASTDEVSFSIVVSNTNENTADNTAENTDANTDANTDVNTADNADANTDANT